MSNFTPGPWFAEMDGKHWTVRAFLDCKTPNKFKTFGLCRILGNRPDNKATAQAIAAVPEMVDWIKGMREAIIAGDSDAITLLLATGRSILCRIEGEEETE